MCVELKQKTKEIQRLCIIRSKEDCKSCLEQCKLGALFIQERSVIEFVPFDKFSFKYISSNQRFSKD